MPWKLVFCFFKSGIAALRQKMERCDILLSFACSPSLYLIRNREKERNKMANEILFIKRVALVKRVQIPFVLNFP